MGTQALASPACSCVLLTIPTPRHTLAQSVSILKSVPSRSMARSSSCKFGTLLGRSASAPSPAATTGGHTVLSWFMTSQMRTVSLQFSVGFRRLIANAIPFFETSAKGNHNVETAFLQLTRDIQKRVSQSALKDPSKNKPKSITLKGAAIDNKQKDGCGC